MITDVKLWTGVTPKLTQSLGTSQFTVPCGLFGLAAEQPVYTPVKITINTLKTACQISDQIKSNQYSFNWQNTTTDTDAKVVYIIPKLLNG